MTLEKIKNFTHRHPIFTLIALILFLYYLYIFWYDGWLAITRTQRLRATARRSIYYKDNLPNIPFPIYPYRKWHRDETVIPTAKEKGDELVPYLADELMLETGIYTSNAMRPGAAQFILIEAIRTKMALNVLVKNLDEKGGVSQISELIGPTALACVMPMNSILKIPQKNYSDYNKQEVRNWYAENTKRLVDTDYGIGITMPDGTIRPLGFHGVQANDFLPNNYYFCTERELVYSINRTFVRNELGNIINSKRQSPKELRLKDNALEEAASSEFRRLFDERVASDKTFWPFYPFFRHIHRFIIDCYIVVGYNDSEHRPHGLWRDIEDLQNGEARLVGERWFFHGEEVTEEEYYERGGYDMDISLCTACPGIPASESAPEQASGQ